MPDRTPFAGLLRLDPQDSLATDNFAFQADNPTIIDRLLQIGALSHRHDAHAKLADPTDDVTVDTVADGGQITADTTIYVVYTLVDSDGGETLPNPSPAVVTTQASLAMPEVAPTAVLDTTGGGLLAGNYSYAITVTDGRGGETMLGPQVDVTIPPGYANAQVVISGLATIAADVGGTGWRLWKMKDGGGWFIVTFGAADEVTDDGTLCPDCTGRPPTSTSQTNATSKLQVTVPVGQPDDAVSFRIYASSALDGSFLSPSLLGEYPVVDLGQMKEYTSLNLFPGAPPLVSRTLGGANQINPDTDMVQFPYKRPVALVADLPTVGNENGDIRLVFEDRKMYAWDDTASEWFAVGTVQGSVASGHTIVDESGTELSFEQRLAFQGNVTVTDDPDNGQTIVTITGGGGAGGVGHEIQDDGVPRAQRAALDFEGAGVTVTDDPTNDRTVVTVPGAGGGGGGGGGAVVVPEATPAVTWTDVNGNDRVRLASGREVTGDPNAFWTDFNVPDVVNLAGQVPGWYDNYFGVKDNQLVPRIGLYNQTSNMSNQIEYIATPPYLPPKPADGQVSMNMSWLDDDVWSWVGPCLHDGLIQPNYIIAAVIDRVDRALKIIARDNASQIFDWQTLAQLTEADGFVWPQSGMDFSLMLDRTDHDSVGLFFYDPALGNGFTIPPVPIPAGIVSFFEQANQPRHGFVSYMPTPYGLIKMNNGWLVDARADFDTQPVVHVDNTSANIQDGYAVVQIDGVEAGDLDVTVVGDPDPGSMSIRIYASNGGYQDFVAGSPPGTYTIAAGERKYVYVGTPGSYVGDLTITVTSTGELKSWDRDTPFMVNDYSTAWNLNKRSLYVQFVPDGGDPANPVAVKLLDQQGTLPISQAQYVSHVFTTTAMGYPDPEMIWANLDYPAPSAAYWRDADGVAHVQGRAVKLEGAAPAAGDVIAKLPIQYRPTMVVLQPVVTGDDDGEEIGAVSINPDTGEITWVFGRSTDPATKHPFVSFDGITFPAYTF